MVHAYLSNPSGASLAALHLNFDDPDIALVGSTIKHWKLQTPYIEEWSQAQFIESTKLFLQKGQIKDSSKFQAGEEPPAPPEPAAEPEVEEEATEDPLEVVYDYNITSGELCRVVVRCNMPRSNPEVPTISSVCSGANWHERETHDFFGIKFTGHPDLSPLLLPEDADFHPLLKDFEA